MVIIFEGLRFFFFSGWSYWSPTRWRIRECQPDMVCTGNIPGRIKTSTAALQLDRRGIYEG